MALYFQPVTGLPRSQDLPMVTAHMRFPTRPIIFFWILANLLVAGPGRAQEVITPPFLIKAVEPLPANGYALQISAQRALEMGFPSIAADLYQRLLDNPATKIELRNQLTVDLATALLDEDRTSEAAAALQKYVGLPTAAYRLRQALIAMREKRYDDARNMATANRPSCSGRVLLPPRAAQETSDGQSSSRRTSAGIHRQSGRLSSR